MQCSYDLQSRLWELTKNLHVATLQHSKLPCSGAAAVGDARIGLRHTLASLRAAASEHQSCPAAQEQVPALEDHV